MADKIGNEQLKKITQEAECGKVEPLYKALKELGYDERIKLLRKIDDLNAKNRGQDPNLPDLVVELGQEGRFIDGMPYIYQLGHHNVYASVRCAAPLFSNKPSGNIYYESFDPISLDRKIYTKYASHWTWNSETIPGK